MLTLIRKDTLLPELFNFSIAVPNSDFYSARVKEMLYISFQYCFFYFLLWTWKNWKLCRRSQRCVITDYLKSDISFLYFIFRQIREGLELAGLICTCRKDVFVATNSYTIPIWTQICEASFNLQMTWSKQTTIYHVVHGSTWSMYFMTSFLLVFLW